MQLFREFVEWQNYVGSLLVFAEEKELEAESELKRAEAIAMAASDEKQVTKAKAEALTDDEVVTWKVMWRQAKAHRKAVFLKVEALDRLANFVSRELSRRIGREPVQRRQQRYGGA